MIRTVLDANAFASGVLRYDSPASTPGEILRRWLSGSFELVTSDHLIDEIERTLLANPYFAARVSKAAGVRWVSQLNDVATWTPITATVVGVATHPEDDLVLAAAVSAGVDYLVTGDKQLQRIGRYEGVVIVSPRDFLTIFDQQEDQEVSPS